MKDTNAIKAFLEEVNYDFPIPVSDKTSLDDLAEKFSKLGTVCCAYDGDGIIAMVAGYTNNTVNDMGYISLVASARKARRSGLATKLIREFLQKAEEKHLTAVHVYTHKTNAGAIAMYKRLGFVPYVMPNEPRPDDVHFIYYLNQQNEGEGVL